MSVKRLIIICEGETEQEFCKALLMPELSKQNISVYCPRIKKSMGGIVKWDDLRKQILNHLRENAFVTLFVDYYGITDKHHFPAWEEVLCKQDKQEIINSLCEGMECDINDRRFIPYIQLHEFESLLFHDIDSFDHVFSDKDYIDRGELTRILEQYPNPEEINNGRDTSPSHRLSKIINGYQKVIYGNIIAMEIGLDGIRNKCPLFNEWVERLLALN